MPDHALDIHPIAYQIRFCLKFQVIGTLCNEYLNFQHTSHDTQHTSLDTDEATSTARTTY